MQKVWFLLLASLILSSGCVSKKKFVEMTAEKDRYESKYKKIAEEKKEVDQLNDECKENVNLLTSRVSQLKNDTTELGKQFRDKHQNYMLLQKSYDMMVQKTKRQLRGKEKEIIDLQNDLIAANNKVKDRESELLLIAKDLHEQKEEFEQVKAEFMLTKSNLDVATSKLSEKEKKLVELQSSLNKQDSLVKALKKKVTAAFMDYENKGLKVEMKNGKVYVSLEEKLLFATGSTTINARGEEALKKLSQILENDSDINVMVEGHTDDIPYVTPVNGIKDNWDLSVMRATTIVRIILKHGKIDPQRVIPAGRGPYVPIDDAKTAEARAKNRRIEIILTPKLDELFQILETN